MLRANQGKSLLVIETRTRCPGRKQCWIGQSSTRNLCISPGVNGVGVSCESRYDARKHPWHTFIDRPFGSTSVIFTCHSVSLQSLDASSSSIGQPEIASSWVSGSLV